MSRTPVGCNFAPPTFSCPDATHKCNSPSGGKLPQFQILSNQQAGALTEDFQLGSNGVVRRKDFGKLGFREVQVFMEDAFEQGDNVQGRA